MQADTTLIDGEFSDRVPVQDRGFAYGDGVFRTMRMVSGVPLHWPLHYQKLSADCAAIGIVCPSAETLMDDITKLFAEEVTERTDSVAKIVITRGIGKRGYAPPAIMSPMRVVSKLAAPTYKNDFYKLGVSLRVCDLTLSKQPKLAGIKHLNRMENVLARMEWQDEQFFDGILRDDTGLVIECTMCNIFARFDNQLLTPLLNETGVAGVTRGQVMQLGNTFSMTVKEQNITMEQLLSADEVMVTNSLFGVFQVTKIADQSWPVMSLSASLRSLIDYDSTH